MSMKRLLQSCFFIFVSVILLGCSTTNKEPDRVKMNTDDVPIRALRRIIVETPMTSPVVVAAPNPAPLTSKPSQTYSSNTSVPSGGTASFIPFKQLLVRPDPPSGSYYTFVYFPSQATTSKLKTQYELICQMWQSHFLPKAEVLMYKDVAETPLPVYWLLRDLRSSEDSCENLVRWYDYMRAISILPKKSRPNTPSLVAVIGKSTIIMDLQGLTSEEDIDRAFTIWKEHIAVPKGKNEDLNAVTLAFSAKKALGILAGILQLKT